MKIAVIGAGFTGLSCALRLLEQGHEVVIIEREGQVGGLAGGFKSLDWDWSLEKAYHHLFTNDHAALSLAKELGQEIIITRPQTNVFVNNKITSLDSPSSLLSFSHLSLLSRLRLGFVLFYLKYTSRLNHLKDKKALPWLRYYMGTKTTKMIWEPLFAGKFGKYAEDISLTWFWARIKKRGTYLAYPKGGFQHFLDTLAKKVEDLGGEIKLNTEVKSIKSTKDDSVILEKHNCHPRPDRGSRELAQVLNSHLHGNDDCFDKVIVTIPTPIFTKITSDLPKSYVNKISTIAHLSALNLILVLPKKFFDSTYWLNITDRSFPFLVMAEHTNFMDSNHYGKQHILYIGNYLPPDHIYLKMTPQQLLKIYEPFLKKISPNYTLNPIRCYLFKDPFAQPVVTTDYLKHIPEFKTPLQNIYLANLDMVYPWDRGTNYAIELGEKAAKLIV